MPASRDASPVQGDAALVRVWCAAFVAANLALVWLGPRLTSRLPKEQTLHAPEALGVVYARDFQGLFESHALSLPKRPGEIRVVVSGNCMVESVEARQSLHQAVVRRCPQAELYWLAWGALSVSDQAGFLDRALAYDPDVIVWAIAMRDCRSTRGVFMDEVPALAVRYGSGPIPAVRNLAYLNWDNGWNVVHHLYGCIVPGERYIGALQLSAPPIIPEPPDIPEELRDGNRTSVPIHPPSRFPISQAIKALDELGPRIRAAGSQLVVAILPVAYADESFGPGALHRFRSSLGSWCKAHDAALADLSGVLPPESFTDDVHFDRRHMGLVYDRLADAMVPALECVGR